MNNIENQTIINEVVKRIKRSDFVHQIKSYLKGQGLNEAEIDAYYLKGKEALVRQKMDKLPKRNKLIFGLVVAALIAVIVAFTVFLPASGSLKITAYAITGSFLFFILLFLAIHLFGSWNPERIREKYEKKKDKDALKALGIALIPAFIMYFVFSFSFQIGANNLLKETMVSANGVITFGFSNQSATSSTTELTIEFQTSSGQTIEVKEEVSERDFNDYYLDQTIPIVYSSQNPYHYKLLMTDALVAEYLGTNNREITVDDLIGFFDVPADQMTTHLNDISYIWEKNMGSDNWWTNNARMEDIMITGETIEYTTPKEIYNSYPRVLEKMGFREIDHNISGDIMTAVNEEKIYQSKDYVVSVSMYFGEEIYMHAAAIMKR